MLKMANQLSCLILVTILQLCMVSSSSDFFNYFHAYYHKHKKQSTTDEVSSSTSGYSSTREIPSSMAGLFTTLATYYSEPAVSSSVEDSFPSAGRSTEENDEIVVTQKSYPSKDFDSYLQHEQMARLTAVRLFAIGGGIFLFITLVCCVGCYCRGGFGRRRTGMVIGQSAQSLVPQSPQTVAVESVPPLDLMPPPPPPYTEEKSQQLPYYQNTTYYPPEVEQQFHYSPSCHNPPTAPPPYQDRY